MTFSRRSLFGFSVLWLVNQCGRLILESGVPVSDGPSWKAARANAQQPQGRLDYRRC